MVISNITVAHTILQILSIIHLAEAEAPWKKNNTQVTKMFNK